MAVVVMGTDLTLDPPEFFKMVVEWQPGFTAFDALSEALGDEVGQQIADDLTYNRPNVTVTWYNNATGESSGIGGMDSLDHALSDKTILTVNYETDVTTDRQRDEAMHWMFSLEDELFEDLER